MAWRKLACGIDPWMLVDLATGAPASAAVTPEEKQQRADMYPEIISSWLLAAVGRSLGV